MNASMTRRYAVGVTAGALWITGICTAFATWALW